MDQGDQVRRIGGSKAPAGDGRGFLLDMGNGLDG